MTLIIQKEALFSYCKQIWLNKYFFLHIAYKTPFQFIDVAINIYVHVWKFYITNRESTHIHSESLGKFVGPNHSSLRYEITVYIIEIMTSAVMKIRLSALL